MQHSVHETLCFILCAGALGVLVSNVACDGDTEPEPQLQWYQTCGDPACAGYTPQPNDTVCSTEVEGEVCAASGQSCAIANDDCNTRLLCTDTDPATMCPISQAAKKRDIRHVDTREREALARALLGTRLATYRYASEPEGAPRRVGFLIDDQPTSPAVLPSGERVDLYGYTSMAVAALQAQAEEIRRLGLEVERLRTEIEALRQAGARQP